jgi:hypothetical protein
MSYQDINNALNNASNAMNNMPRADDADTQRCIDRLLADLESLCDQTNDLAQAERNKTETAYNYRELGSVSQQCAFDQELDGYGEADIPVDDEARCAFIDAQLESYGAVFRSDGARLDH